MNTCFLCFTPNPTNFIPGKKLFLSPWNYCDCSVFVDKSLKGECVACFPPGGQETAAHVSSCSGRVGGSPGERESVGSSYGCINVTPILTNELLELLQVLGEITRSVACKAIFFGMCESSALVGNAGTGNVFIQCEQITLLASVMGHTHTESPG